MSTVKEFIDLGVVDYRVGDVFTNEHGEVCDASASISAGYGYGLTVESFAWRPLNTLPHNPKFKFEYNTGSIRVQWRPLLDQSAVNTSGDKPVSTQAMDDIEYELSLHKANSELLASLTDFMVKNSNSIGRIGESCIDVAIRELSEKFNIDQRTPKQKAVDEMLWEFNLQKHSHYEVLLTKAYESWVGVN